MAELRQKIIGQGEFAVGTHADEVFSTILGSCVSICFWDPLARIGGMNHMLLPEAAHPLEKISAGAFDLERLINAMIRQGAERKRLRAKVFGGASMLQGMTDIGGRNARFPETYLEREGIVCEALSVGGSMARHIRFWPESGVARQKLVREVVPTAVVPEPPVGHGVELF